MTNHPMARASLIAAFGGWVAWNHGCMLINRDRTVKTYPTAEAAQKAANKAAAVYEAKQAARSK